MDSFIMKPKIDFAFKEIMTDEKARTGFLSAVLKLEPEEIRKTELLNTNLRKVHEDDKLGILDVRVSLNDSTEIGGFYDAGRKRPVHRECIPEAAGHQPG